MSTLHPWVCSFNGDAASVYDAGRAALPAVVVEAFGLPAGCRVLDLAAGTGLVSTALRDAGHDVVAVEPLADMRQRLALKLGADRALGGTAEAIPLPDASVDAVTVGDAYHWFTPDAAVAEMFRVLRPGGSVVLLWRYTDWPDAPDWMRRVWSRLGKLRGAAHPGFVGDQGRGAFARHGGFSDLVHTSVPFIKPNSRAGMAAHLRSISYVAKLPDRKRKQLLHDVDDDMRCAGVDHFDEPHSAQLWICHKLG